MASEVAKRIHDKKVVFWEYLINSIELRRMLESKSIFLGSTFHQMKTGNSEPTTASLSTGACSLGFADWALAFLTCSPNHRDVDLSIIWCKLRFRILCLLKPIFDCIPQSSWVWKLGATKLDPQPTQPNGKQGLRISQFYRNQGFIDSGVVCLQKPRPGNHQFTQARFSG